MIDQEEVLNLLSGNMAEKVVCLEFELRPSKIADYIKKMANLADNYGYVIIGVVQKDNQYTIKGIGAGYHIENVVSKAVQSLTVLPNLEYEKMQVMQKTIYVIKIWKAEGGTAIKNDRIHNESITQFIKDLYGICIKLQGNAKYINASEDERNDYIRDMLETKGYHVKDQTRRGVSFVGKTSGEVDLFILKNEEPFTIVEALNLSSLDKNYLNKHLDKIYSYDTLGNSFNVCLTYASVKDLAGFWERYCKHVSEHQYPYPLVEIDDEIDNEFDGSDIKVMTTTLNRSGQYTLLYHIVVKIMT